MLIVAVLIGRRYYLENFGAALITPITGQYGRHATLGHGDTINIPAGAESYITCPNSAVPSGGRWATPFDITTSSENFSVRQIYEYTANFAEQQVSLGDARWSGEREGFGSQPLLTTFKQGRTYYVYASYPLTFMCSILQPVSSAASSTVSSVASQPVSSAASSAVSTASSAAASSTHPAYPCNIYVRYEKMFPTGYIRSWMKMDMNGTNATPALGSIAIDHTIFPWYTFDEHTEAYSGLQIDYVHRRAYVAHFNKIYSANLDGTDIRTDMESAPEAIYIESYALDTYGNQLFWFGVSETGSVKLYRQAVNGGPKQLLLTTQKYPYDLAVDMQYQKLYFFLADVGPGEEFELYRMNMDGTGLTQIHISPKGYIRKNTLAVDWIYGYVFWLADHGAPSIYGPPSGAKVYRSDLDGNNVQIIHEVADQKYAHEMFALDVDPFTRQLYLLRETDDQGNKSIWRMNEDGTNGSYIGTMNTFDAEWQLGLDLGCHI